MSIPDETLMAFVDGELDPSARAAVESALREDPQLAKRVARHVALRQRLRDAYASELAEPVPPRLLDTANRVSGQSNKVVSLQEARDAKARGAAAAPPRATGWRAAAAIAASVAIGFGLGYANRNGSQSETPLVRGGDGALIAGGVLAKALSTQLALQRSETLPVDIGVSFLAKNGEYCRSFSLQGSSHPSGLACHQGEQWRLVTVEQSGGVAGPGYRTAGTDIAPHILQAIEERIDGEPLDAFAEKQALQKDWHK
jgi:anti-sigma-K factor RskA